MKFLRIFSPAFMTRLDKYMLVHYPVLWTTRIHYTLFWGAVLYLLVWLLGDAVYPSVVAGTSFFPLFVSIFTVPICVFSLIIWLVYLSKYKIEQTAGQKTVLSAYHKFGAYFITLFMIAAYPFAAQIHEDHQVAGLHIESRYAPENEYSRLTMEDVEQAKRSVRNRHESYYIAFSTIALAGSILVFILTTMPIRKFLISIAIAFVMYLLYMLFSIVIVAGIDGGEGGILILYTFIPIIAIILISMLVKSLFFTRGDLPNVSNIHRSIVILLVTLLPFAPLIIYQSTAITFPEVYDHYIGHAYFAGIILFIICLPFIDKVFTRMAALPAR